MTETIDESVSVDLLSNHIKKMAYPWVIHWKGNRYMVAKIGMHHTVREGRVLFRILSVSDGSTFFKLRFDTETLGWRLLEIEN